MCASPVHSALGVAKDADILDRLAQSERLLTARELAALLAVSPKTLYSYVERNLIPHFKIESNVRFRGREVAEWLRHRGFGGDHLHASVARDPSLAKLIGPRHFLKRGGPAPFVEAANGR